MLKRTLILGSCINASVSPLKRDLEENTVSCPVETWAVLANILAFKILSRVSLKKHQLRALFFNPIRG